MRRLTSITATGMEKKHSTQLVEQHSLKPFGQHEDDNLETTSDGKTAQSSSIPEDKPKGSTLLTVCPFIIGESVKWLKPDVCH